jgi:propanediol dehydratase small subunit
MKIPPQSPSFSEEDMETAAETLKWQAASARAAGAKHRARLIDQLESQQLDDTPAGDVSSPV